jgi:outer membrane protein TolC
LAREKLREEIHQTAQQVKQAYYELAQIQTQIESAATALKYLTELQAYAERNLAQETALKSDVLNAKAKLMRQQYQLLTLHENLENQKEALNRLLGRDLRIDFSVEMGPPPSEDETNLPAAQNKALQQRPEIRQARLQSRKAELEVKRQRVEYIPNASFDVSYVSFPNVYFFPQNVVSAGLLLDWQPFDWGLKKHRIAELRSALQQAALSEYETQQAILLDVNASYRKLAEARSLLRAESATQEAEREKLRVLTNRYKEKSALLTDVLQQQSSVAQSDAQHQQALSDFWTAKAAFERALGDH